MKTSDQDNYVLLERKRVRQIPPSLKFLLVLVLSSLIYICLVWICIGLYVFYAGKGVVDDFFGWCRLLEYIFHEWICIGYIIYICVCLLCILLYRFNTRVVTAETMEVDVENPLKS